MDAHQSQLDGAGTSQEAHVLVGEYEELLAEIKELKKRANELYVKVTKEKTDTEVARTLEHILHIPE